MVIAQYPHTIEITEQGSLTYDGDGNPIADATTVAFRGICRAEPNGTGQVLKGEDGSVLEYGWNVYLPKMNVNVTANAEAVIVIDGRSIKGTVKRHSNGQLNSRLWV